MPLRLGNKTLAVARAQTRHARGDWPIRIGPEQVFHEPVDARRNAIVPQRSSNCGAGADKRSPIENSHSRSNSLGFASGHGELNMQ